MEDNKEKRIHIYRNIVPNGFNISFLRHSYDMSFPPHIWKEFPQELRQNFADAITYFLTMHLALSESETTKLVYHFPPPGVEPFFLKGLMFSLGETVLMDEQKKLTISNLLKLIYNRFFNNIEFTGGPRYARFKNINRNSKKRVIIPFSFGKDSLLTYALSNELGINPSPVFFREPRCSNENRHKARLAQRFFDEFDVEVNIFPMSTGWLRQMGDKWWGWDLLLTQYSLLMIPYLFGHRAKYLFWAHEQSCNDTFIDDEGFIVNPVFEQNKDWLMSTNCAARVLGCNSVFSSIIEPIYEIAVMKILHYRYPEIGKYQMSCFAEEAPSKTKRWCGVCSKCARIYIFMKALGISPKRVGFNEDMLSERKKRLYSLFHNGDQIKDGTYDESGLGRDEQLLAFYLAYKKGAKGALINEFRKKYLAEARKREKELRSRFFGIHSLTSIPTELRKPLLRIYKEELQGLGGNFDLN